MSQFADETGTVVQRAAKVAFTRFGRKKLVPQITVAVFEVDELEANYSHKRASEQAMRLENEEPREAIRKLVTLTWNYYIDHPEFMNLLNSANLHQARHIQASPSVKKMRNPFIHMIGNILDNGVKAGVFKPGVDPVQLYISIAGLSYFYLSNQHTLSAIFGDFL